jgi:hypothetical protein
MGHISSTESFLDGPAEVRGQTIREAKDISLGGGVPTMAVDNDLDLDQDVPDAPEVAAPIPQ